MPHNKTRLWVGMAILGITIPAVGQYLYRASTADGGTIVAQEARWNAGSGVHSVRPVLARPATPVDSRDYLAEVARMTKSPTANGGDSTPVGAIGQAEPTLDWMLDESDPYDEAIESDLPDPAQALASNAGVPSDAATANPSDDPSLTDAQDANDAGPVAASNQGPSDGQIYNEMLAGFTDTGDRDAFVRTWALMSPEQRAEVLDDYRKKG